MLIIIVRCPVASAVGARPSDGGAIDEPVWFGDEVKITAAAREEAGFDRGAEAVLRERRVLEVFGPVDGSDSGNGHGGVGDGLHRAGGVADTVVDGWNEI